ncbi:hypothetical protein GCM10027190_63030 [Spirosoma areae]
MTGMTNQTAYRAATRITIGTIAGGMMTGILTAAAPVIPDMMTQMTGLLEVGIRIMTGITTDRMTAAIHLMTATIAAIPTIAGLTMIGIVIGTIIGLMIAGMMTVVHPMTDTTAAGTMIR